MAYPTLDTAKPDGATQDGAEVLQVIRDHQRVLRDQGVVGAGFAWDYSRTGGTATQPAVEYFKKGAEWLQLTLTWGSSGGATGQITVTVYKYSANSGGAYDTIGTETRTHNSDGQCVATTWS